MPTIKIGDKILEIDKYENGIPVIKATAVEVKNANGGTDVIVKVPCLKIISEK